MYSFHLLATDEDRLTFQDACAHHNGVAPDLAYLKNSNVLVLGNRYDDMLGGFVLNCSFPHRTLEALEAGEKTRLQNLLDEASCCEVSCFWIRGDQHETITGFLLFAWMALEVSFAPVKQFVCCTANSAIQQYYAQTPGAELVLEGFSTHTEQAEASFRVYRGAKTAILKGVWRMAMLMVKEKMGWKPNAIHIPAKAPAFSPAPASLQAMKAG